MAGLNEADDEAQDTNEENIGWWDSRWDRRGGWIGFSIELRKGAHSWRADNAIWQCRDSVILSYGSQVQNSPVMFKVVEY